MCLGKQRRTAKVPRPLPPLWKTHMECPAVAAIWGAKQRMEDSDIGIPSSRPSMSLSPSNKELKLKKKTNQVNALQGRSSVLLGTSLARVICYKSKLQNNPHHHPSNPGIKCVILQLHQSLMKMYSTPSRMVNSSQM